MDVFEALADPTRRQIISMLAAGELNAGEIAGRFTIAGPSVSRHLRVLRESGLVTVTPVAQTRIYHLEREGLAAAKQWMDSQLTTLHARFGALEAHLERMQERGD